MSDIRKIFGAIDRSEFDRSPADAGTWRDPRTWMVPEEHRGALARDLGVPTDSPLLVEIARFVAMYRGVDPDDRWPPKNLNAAQLAGLREAASQLRKAILEADAETWDGLVLLYGAHSMNEEGQPKMLPDFVTTLERIERIARPFPRGKPPAKRERTLVVNLALLWRHVRGDWPHRGYDPIRISESGAFRTFVATVRNSYSLKNGGSWDGVLRVICEELNPEDYLYTPLNGEKSEE